MLSYNHIPTESGKSSFICGYKTLKEKDTLNIMYYDIFGTYFATGCLSCPAGQVLPLKANFFCFELLLLN